MDNDNSKIACYYARVSTGRQENEETIESQIAELKERIKRDKNYLSPEHEFSDDGWTGTILARPGLDTLRDTIKRKEVKILYVYDLGRLSREFFLQLLLLNEFKEAGVKVISLHDINPENDEQNFLRNIMGAFHDYERVKIVERFRRGKLHKAKNGMLIQGQGLFGYTYIKKTDKKPPKIILNEKEAEHVRMIFNLFGNEGKSIKELVRILYKKGIHPRKQKNEFWSTGPILRLLRCDSYITGVIYYNKSEAVETKNPRKDEKYRKVKKGSRRVRPSEEWYPYKVPKILDDWNLFNRVQKILDNNRRHGPRKKKYDYLLSGLVFCECGNRRAGDGVNNNNYYYRCSERVLMAPRAYTCKSPGMNAYVLDKVFCEELGKYLTDPSNINQIAKDYLKAQAFDDGEERERQRIQHNIDKFIEEEKRYLRVYGAGEIDFEQFKEIKSELNKRKKAEEEELKKLNLLKKEIKIDNVELQEFCQEVKEVLQSLNYSTKSLLIRDIIDKIVLKGTKNEVEVMGHIPINHLNIGYELISRDCRSSKCRKKHVIQCVVKEAGGRCGAVSVLYHRAKRWRGSGT